MTKADLVETIYEKIGFSRKESAEIVDLVFDLMKETLEGGEKIKISGFGNFIVRQKRSRKGRNPQTGTEIQISARRVLTFKPSQVLRKSLNTGRLKFSPRGRSGSGVVQRRWSRAMEKKLPASIPEKLYYKIGEVSQYTGVEPYVLRYWESEFKIISPLRTNSKQRSVPEEGPGSDPGSEEAPLPGKIYYRRGQEKVAGD